MSKSVTDVTFAAALRFPVAAAGVCCAAALAFAGAAAAEPLAPVSASAASNEMNPRWSPTGRYLSLERDDGTSRTVEVYAAEAGSAPRLVETLAVRPEEGGRGFLLDAAPQAPTYNAWLSWAPDETRFAFVSSGGAGQYDLYLSGVGRGGAAERVTNDAAADGQVAWSPAGDRLAFVSGRTDQGDLYLLDLATRAVTRLTADRRSVLHPEWSPDGRRLAFAIGDGENHDVCVLDGVGGKAAPARRCLTAWPFDDLRPRWSPDGRRIAFYSSYNADGEAGVWSLFVVAADGSDPVKGKALLSRRVDTGVVVDLEVGPAFTPDGGGLVYAKRVDRDFNPLYLADLAARTTRRLATGQSIHHDVALAPDGRLAVRAQVARWDRVLTGRLSDLVAAEAADASEARR